MKRILFCVVPEKGHLNPCIGPAQHLHAAGFDVAFYAPANISEQLASAGAFTFLGSPDTPERASLSRGASFAANIEDVAWLRRWVHTLLIGHTSSQIDGLRQVVRQWRPDAMVIDPLFYAPAIVAELEGVPWAALSNSLNPVLPDDLDSELLRTLRWLAPERDQLFARYGLTARFRGCDILSPHLTIAFATEDFVGTPPLDVELVGPSLPVGLRGDETPFPWEWLDAARPLVYMSLGSQLYYQPEVFAKVIEALRTTPAQLVLSAGELADTDRLPRSDECVVAVRYAPQLDLLQRSRVFISHGGANSVMEALACGVPMLLSPFCNDQFHSAYFVERAGVGHCLDLRRASVADIADTLGSLLHSSSPVRDRAERIRTSYARDGSARAARLIGELASGNRLATRS